jgi:hypothetical protein
MPKAKLTLKAKDDVKKIAVASFVSGVKTGDAVPFQDNLHVEINYPSVDSLVNFGRVLETCTGKELDQMNAAKGEKKATK